MEQMKCPYCGKMVDKPRMGQKTCGAPECVKARHKWTAANKESRKCIVCRKMIRAKNQEKRVCSDECLKIAERLHSCLGITL